MLKFFDRIYIQLYLIRNSENESKKRDWASSILTLLQGLNALTLYILLGFIGNGIQISKFVIIVVCIFLIVFNIIRYQYSESRCPSKLQEFFEKQTGQREIAKNNILLIYILGTVATCVLTMVLYRTNQLDS